MVAAERGPPARCSDFLSVQHRARRDFIDFHAERDSIWDAGPFGCAIRPVHNSCVDEEVRTCFAGRDDRFRDFDYISLGNDSHSPLSQSIRDRGARPAA